MSRRLPNPTCPLCGQDMRVFKGARGSYWVCVNQRPRACYGTRAIKDLPTGRDIMDKTIAEREAENEEPFD